MVGLEKPEEEEEKGVEEELKLWLLGNSPTVEEMKISLGSTSKGILIRFPEE